MANRAYLFSSDHPGPDVWRAPQDIYYDSRWTVPLAWWFLFRARDVTLVGVRYGESSWQEVKFVADRDDALAAFAGRRGLLLRVLGLPAEDEAVTHFFEDIRAWPGKYLLMDPEEVFAWADEPGEGHHRRCVRILEAIDAGAAAAEEVADAVRPYTAVQEFDSRDDFIEQVVGYTYR